MEELLRGLLEVAHSLWETGSFWARVAIAIVILWPFDVILAALLSPPRVVIVAVPLVALIPLLSVLFGIIAAFNPLVIAALGAIPAGRRVLGSIAAIVGTELAVGVYFSLVPVWRDRALVPVVVLASAAILFLSLAKKGSVVVRILIFLLLFFTLVFFLGGRRAAISWLEGVTEGLRPPNNSAVVGPGPQPTVEQYAGYGAARCSQDEPQDFSQDQGDKVVIALQLGCYRGPITAPVNWSTFQVFHNGGWATVWCDGSAAPHKIHPSNENFGKDFENCYSSADASATFYAQGQGTITLRVLTQKEGGGTASADVAPSESSSDTVAPPPKAPAIPAVAAGDFKFEVKSCTKNGARIRCYGTVTNTSLEPQNLFFRWYESYVADNLGNVAPNGSWKIQVGNGSDKPLLPDVPIAWSFQTDDEGSGVTNITIVLAVAAGQFPLPMERNPLAALKNIPLEEK
jgi:hypothetical protein